MKGKLILILIVFSFTSGLVNAQKENNNWYFGALAGMNFSTNQPTPLFNSGLNSIEGCASVSDSLGNLLFYTNGTEVFTKSHNLMQNGSGLNGFFSDAQPASIVRLPGSANLYYIFYSSGVSVFRAGGYAIVDMNLDNGLGKVISKNNVFANNVTEGMVVVPHADTGKFWIVYNVLDSAEFQSFLFDCHGVSNNRIVSNGGVPLQFGLVVSNLNVSPDHKKIISAALYFDDACLMDFDNSTGILSNPIHIPLSQPYGNCFSPNSKVVYINHTIWDLATGTGTNTLAQFDISSNNAATILASKITLDTIISTYNGEFGQMQLAPDNKLYVARFFSTVLPSVSNPDIVGFGCGYLRNGFDISPNTCNLGLPAIAYASPFPTIPKLLADDTTLCANQISLTANYNTGPYLWNTGETTQSISVNQSGQYWVNAKMCLTDFSDSISITLDPAFQFQLTSLSNNIDCNKSQTLAPSRTGDAYLWNTHDTTPSITVNQNGLYLLEISKGTCKSVDTITVNIDEKIPAPTIPNVFTPNGDNLNDYFEIKSDCYDVTEARIFNRWGELLKETINSNIIWDGKSNGKSSPTGVYYYLMTLQNNAGDLQQAHGSLTLIR